MNPTPPPPAQPLSSPPCRTCGQGAMVNRKTFRMSGPVVTIGFILLVPSGLGMLFGGLMLLASIIGGTQGDAIAEREVRDTLAPQRIPPGIVEDIIAGKPLDDTRLVDLTLEQRRVVRAAELARSSSKTGAALAGSCGCGLSGLSIIGSFVGGLLGWLLIMRKRVLQCVRCGAVVSAS